jgi:hypothetical protein
VIRTILSLLLVVMLLGCKSRPLGPYTSPPVTGQVLAADTDQPLANVLVIRGSGEARRMSPPKGAELLMRKAPAQTDVNGMFELASERVLSVVRGAGWNIVSLSFDRNGYQRFQTNCPISRVTNRTSGEPVLDVGRILLQPTVK